MSRSFLERRSVRVLGAVLGVTLVAAAAVREAPPSQTAQGDGPPDWIAVVVGPPHGTLEPCGCAGGMLGGIDRLGSAVRVHSQSRVAPAVAVAAGGFLSRDAVASGVGPWQQSQIEALFFAFGTLGIDAIGLSAQELGLPRATFEQARGYLGNVPIVATNLFDEEGASPFDVALRHAATGVTVLCLLAEGVTGAGEPAWSTVPVDAALERLRARGENLGSPGKRLVLVEGDEARARAVAARFDTGDVIAWYGGRGDASGAAVPLATAGRGPVGGFAGERLRHVVVVRARGDERRWDSQPVDQALPSDEALATAQAIYREFLAGGDAVGAYAGSAGQHPRGAYAGSQSCAACHTEAHATWLESAHSHAISTLERDLRGEWPATVDPACVRCHTVGFGHESGFGVRSARERDMAAMLGAVGCESCHGPGANHVRSGLARDILKSDASTCMTCHDAENDPGFVFERKWPLIRHDAR